MKIGIMGGTFNPIHNAHIALAVCAYEQFELDQVIFIPTGNPYLKTRNGVEGNELAEATHRLEMTRLAIAQYPYFTCSSMEIERTGPTYTADTLEELCKSGDDYYFIMGEDSFLYMDHWKEPQKIFDCAVILVAVRPGENDSVKGVSSNNSSNSNSNNGHVNRIVTAVKEYQSKFSNVRVKLLPVKEQDISSTDIRRRLQKKLSLEQEQGLYQMLPKDVLEYIRMHKLYQ